MCWLANMVVAIPVSFMPLAVFLARPNHSLKNSDLGVEAAAEEDDKQKDEKTDACDQCVCPQDVGLSPANNSLPLPDTHKDASGKRNQLKENLKFYLGADISKKKGKKEDEVCILDKQECNESPA